jgi:hypothetical protein
MPDSGTVKDRIAPLVRASISRWFSLVLLAALVPSPSYQFASLHCAQWIAVPVIRCAGRASARAVHGIGRAGLCVYRASTRHLGSGGEVRVLSAEERARFWQDGFLLVEDFNPLEELAHVRERLEPIFWGDFDTGVCTLLEFPAPPRNFLPYT